MEWLVVVAVIVVQAIAAALVIVRIRRERTEAATALEFGLREVKETTERQDRGLRDEFARNRHELAESLARATASLTSAVSTLSQSQKAELDGFSARLVQQAESQERRLESMRLTVDERLRLLSEENARKLDQMRQTVDEKLQGTLEQRLGESFKQVSDRLEMVHRGLGEMQTLAVGVGDLKKVLSNVKSRGTLAEVQLGLLLEQLLSAEQFARNVETRTGSNQRVEYAVKLPGREGQNDFVWLPIDAKFPMDDYQRLVEAQERSDAPAAESAGQTLEATIKSEARKIRSGYLNPPATTDFAIMYLGTEGLFAEVLRRPGLMEHLQREYRVTPAGPTTLSALLNSLQMGFRTLAIQKRASEVWGVLGSVKTEFGKFGDLLDGVGKKLQEAQNKIEDVTRKSRTIEKKLLGVQSLSAESAEESQDPAASPMLELM